jgi:hypothetical protein
MPISGQTTVTAAGTAVPLGSQQIAAPLMVKALSANTGLVFLGNDGAGDVTSANGMQLAAGEMVIFNHVANLSALYLDAAVNGEGVCWLVLEA